METFVWDDNFVTGLSKVDEQHRKLVDLFNELSHSLFLTDDNRETVLNDTFARVVDYTRYHFQDEEALMRAEGVDARHMDTHHAMHTQFVAQVTSMWERRNSISTTGESLVSFLTSWLSLHILGVDQALARQIQLIRQGTPAAAAFEREAQAHDSGMQAVLKLIGNLYHVLFLQNTELAQANQHLEERVAQRTLELANANKALEQAYTRLESYSRIDGLLQIANRKYFDLRLREAWASAFRRKQALGLLMIDVDFFKRYNDSYGHQAGDACLQAVAMAVQKTLQRSTDLVARYGGEELAVILPDTDEAGTIAMAQRVVAGVMALALPHKASDAAPVVTVSVGAACQVPSEKAADQTLLTLADAALYRAKAAGRNRWAAAT
ncbi:bacteriohemerythrin [Rhodoferax sp.]|uniref:GGDEF domain-containing protein n=1 Tax=Rhodoferax sp. TaxID=50421 RepID=UPI00271B1638|nr:bacteriohemerythrin [Rhodoferax sp.]MDO9143731.1 bacteriohemerythrin [Rhodoferax sp.]MDP3865760.1 bacteriohemerythrin [Rhodoferax sp.]